MRIIPKKGVPPTDNRAMLEGFAEACRAKGLRVTHQRMAVYEAVLSSRSHPGAEEIYQIVRGKFPTVSRGTVYRILETLCGMGLVNDVNRTADTARFEAAREPHHHLVCIECRRIDDLYDESLHSIPARAGRNAKTAGFEVTAYQIQFVGYCRDCRRNPGSKRTNREKRHGQRS